MVSLKSLRKVITLCLVIAMFFSLAACGASSTSSGTKSSPSPSAAPSAAPTATPSTPKAYKAGKYDAQINGHNAPIKMAVTFSDTAITAVEVLEHKETAGVGTPAIERLPGEIVKYQSLAVDTIAGATVTSKAVIAGVEVCVQKAGGDVQALKNKAVTKTAGQKETKTADVIVVGGGGAGMSAAVSAVEKGASVILIEKTAALGGNTLVSGGAWNAANTKLSSKEPAAAGLNEKLKSFLAMKETELPADFRPTLKVLKDQITKYLAGDTTKMFDSTELHIIQTYFAGKRQGLDGTAIEGQFKFIEILCGKSLETQEWLKSTVGSVFADQLSEPIGALWKRSNNVKDKLDDYFTKLANYVKKNNGQILLEVTGKELIVEGGKVVGVKAVKSDGTSIELRANKGVVMATGGFGANTEMVIKYNNYWPQLDPNILTTNVKGAQGDGINMGLGVGANLTGMGYTQLMPIGWADTGKLAFGGGSNVMYINKQGKRFVNEYAERDVISMAAFKNGTLFYELKKLGTDPFPAPGTPESSVMFIANTLEEMAKKIGCDSAVLKSEVEKYNSFVEKGKDTDFGKTSFTAKVEAPYVARAMKPSIHHTMGGLVIDTDCHVLNKEGKVIPGFYAAGEVTGGIHAGNRVGGNAIADVYTFGRIAGANAAAAK